MINSFINKYFFYLYVFTLCFGVLLYNTTGFKGLDVVSSLILVVLYLIFVIGTKNRSFHIGFIAVILVFLFFLNYSFYIANNSLNAIAIDFLTQLRPYVAFFLVLQISPTFTEKQKTTLKKICFYIWLFYIPIGLLAIVNPSFLSTLIDQPSNYTACITCLAIVHLFCSKFTVKDKLTFVFMLAAGLITIHSRFYIFFLVVCGLLMYFHHADVLKSNLKTGFALAVMAGLVIYVSKAEILSHLFSAGITGGGFASLAGQASSSFYAQLNDNGFNPINGFIHQEWFSGSTSYYPFLAQLGMIGIFLYLSFWIYIVAISVIQFKQKGEIQPFIVVILLAVFIFLENISDAFFTSNKGYFMMMFIGLLLGKPEETDAMVMFPDKTSNKKKRFAALQAFWLIRKKSVSHNDKTQLNKQTTYLTHSMPTGNKVVVDEIQTVKTDTNYGDTTDHQKYMPVIQNEVEILNTLQEKKEETITVVSDTQNETITEVASSNILSVDQEEIVGNIVNCAKNEDITEAQLSNDIIPSPEMLCTYADDEFDWEDDFEDDDEDEWETVVELEKEVTCKADTNIEAKVEATSVNTPPLQSDITNIHTPIPTMTYTCNQSDESIQKIAVFVSEENSEDDFAEGSYNYMI